MQGGAREQKRSSMHFDASMHAGTVQTSRQAAYFTGTMDWPNDKRRCGFVFSGNGKLVSVPLSGVR